MPPDGEGGALRWLAAKGAPRDRLSVPPPAPSRRAAPPAPRPAATAFSPSLSPSLLIASTGEGLKWKNTRFVITGKRGKDIKGYSANPTENDMLFKAGTRVRVTKKSNDIGGVRHIYVEEVD